MNHAVPVLLVLILVAVPTNAQTDPFPHGTILDHSLSLTDVAQGDVNSDGVPDLVTTAPTIGGSLVVWTASAGGPHTATVFPSFAGSRVLRLEHFDGDGHLDAVVGGALVVGVMFGDGNGAFSFPVLISSTGTSHLLETSDLDGNGLTDVLTLDTSGALHAVLNHPTGFAAPALVEAGSVLDATVGDFDGDAVPDLAFIRDLGGGMGTQAVVRHGNGAGGFGTESSPPFTAVGLQRVLAIDLNGDVRDDLILMGLDVHPALSTPGGFVAQAIVDVVIPPRGVPLAVDADQDGDLDLVSRTGQFGRTLAVFTGDGAGTLAAPLHSFASVLTVTNGFAPRQFAAADFDGDGSIDIAVCGGNIEILSGIGGGEFGPIRPLPDVRDFGSAAGDIDGDGNLDIVFARSGEIAVSYGDGQAGLGSPVSTPAPLTQPEDVVLGDVNGDGLLDIVVADGGASTPPFQLLLNDGAGSFSVASPMSSGVSLSVDVADFDADGFDDILVVDGTQVFLYDGSSTPLSTFALVASFAEHVRAADLDADGRMDFVTTSFDRLAVSYAEPGGFAPPVTLPFGFGMVDKPHVTDLDRDGYSDLVILSTDTPIFVDTVYYFRGAEDGTFAFPILASTLVDVDDLAITNLDGDGEHEICLIGGGELRLLELTAPGVFDMVASSGLGIGGLVPGDFDGDAVEDLFLVAEVVAGAVLATNPTSDLRGTGDDLALWTTLGPPVPRQFPVKVGRTFQDFQITLTSPGAGFVGEPVSLWTQLFATGDFPSPVPGFPSVHLDFTSPLPPVPILQLAALAAAGATVGGEIPPGIDGISLFLQGFSVSSNAANGQFAATDLHELRLLDLPAPSIASIAPLHASPGDPVTISGNRFRSNASLAIDGIPVPVTSITFGEITFTAPPGVACDATVVVMNDDGQSASRPWNPAPMISAINPTTIATGDSVVITGSFGAPGTNAVTVNGDPATVMAQSETAITFIAPPRPDGPATVRITVVSGCHDEIGLIYAHLPPLITAISPSFVAPGDTVGVTGLRFRPGAVLTVGGMPVALAFLAPTVITFVAPPAAPCDTTVTITNTDGLSDSAPWNPAPVLTTVAPAGIDSDLGGQVSVTGEFDPTDVFSVGGVGVTTVSLGESSAVLAVPPGAVGPTMLTVTRISGCTDSVPFAYLIDPPIIQNVVPDIAPVGATVDINGLQFQSGLVLDVGGTQVVPATVTPTRVTFVVPAGVHCARELRVTNPDGHSSTAPFNEPPTILFASPSSGPAAGGNLVTIAGSGFLPGSLLLFGQTPAMEILIYTTSLIIARAPGGLPGEVGVRIVNPVGCIEDAPYEYLP